MRRRKKEQGGGGGEGGGGGGGEEEETAHVSMWAGIAQMVQQHATGCTVQGSNLGGTRFSAPPPPPRLALEAIQPPIQWVMGHFRG